VKGHALVGVGDAAAARAALVEAEAIAARLGAKPDSALQRRLEGLRETLHEA